MIDKLEAFIILTRAQHFGKAAEELGITHPTKARTAATDGQSVIWKRVAARTK